MKTHLIQVKTSEGARAKRIQPKIYYLELLINSTPKQMQCNLGGNLKTLATKPKDQIAQVAASQGMYLNSCFQIRFECHITSPQHWNPFVME